MTLLQRLGGHDGTQYAVEAAVGEVMKDATEATAASTSTGCLRLPSMVVMPGVDGSNARTESSRLSSR